MEIKLARVLRPVDDRALQNIRQQDDQFGHGRRGRIDAPACPVRARVRGSVCDLRRDPALRCGEDVACDRTRLAVERQFEGSARSGCSIFRSSGSLADWSALAEMS
jgi:hypothetical protein